MGWSNKPERIEMIEQLRNFHYYAGIIASAYGLHDAHYPCFFCLVRGKMPCFIGDQAKHKLISWKP